MRNDGARMAPRALLGLLAAGWLVGLASQVVTRSSSGYMDVYPPQVLLAVLLCVGAGAAVRVWEPVPTGPRRGALAGIAMIALIVVGYFVLTALMWNPIWAGESGETWWSLLLEAPVWIGIPLVTSAASGALGWYAADRMSSRSQPTAHPR